jgi:hypothetical protein
MAGNVPGPGQELLALIVLIVGGLLIVVPLAIYLCITVGFKPTLSFFTIGLHPSKQRRQRHAQDDKTSAGPGRRSSTASPS